MMETIKDILNFCTCAIYFDYKIFGVVILLNILRKCIFDNFNETVPKNKIIETQSIIDNMIFKINENEIENIVDKIYDLRENIILMIGYKKVEENSY